MLLKTFITIQIQADSEPWESVVCGEGGGKGVEGGGVQKTLNTRLLMECVTKL